MATVKLAALLATLALIAACSEPIAEPARRARPLFSTDAITSCPTPATVVVTNEADLLAALAGASSGDVIGLDGVIEVSADVSITTPGIRLTCVTPGSGLGAQAGAGVTYVLSVFANGVAVDHLALDGSNASETSFHALNAGGVGFTDNRVTCAPGGGECGFFEGNTPGAVVADNYFESPGSCTGVHLQLGIDGSRVERNTIVTTGPQTQECQGLGAIRVRDGSNVLVADNIVRGPWINSIATANLAGTFEGNDLAGASGNAVRARGVHDVLFTNNAVSCGAESCALFEGTGGDTRTTIADNRFEAAGSSAGVQLVNMDGAQVTGNNVVASAPASEGILASGIAATGGAGLALTDNVVTGPWSEAALSFQGVFGSRIERNHLAGALDDPVDLFNSENAQFLDNTVQCGSSCFFADGSPRLVMAGNYFESAGSFTGVHLQNVTDSDRVERNTIVATAPSTAFGFGGIRVRDGRNVVVADNVVEGPWSNSIATTTMKASQFRDNRLEGAGVNGIRFNVGTASVPIAMLNNSFRNNQVSGSGDGGIFVQAACRNTFVGNNLNGNASDLGLIFTATAGENVLIIRIDNTASFIDDGDFDCNRDGRPDPNIITGPGRVMHGVPFNAPADVAAASSKRFR